MCVDGNCFYNAPIGPSSTSDGFTGERDLNAGQNVALYISPDGDSSYDSTGMRLTITRICP